MGQPNICVQIYRLYFRGLLTNAQDIVEENEGGPFLHLIQDHCHLVALCPLNFLRLYERVKLVQTA